LLHRERTGQGQYLEATLLDTYFQMHEVNVPRVSLRKSYQPKRTGSQHPDGGPTGIFKCGDGTYLSMALLPHQWKLFCEAVSRNDLLTDIRFTTAALRRDNNEALKAIFEDWLAGFANRNEAITALDQFRIPCAPVLTLNEAISHPHLRERGTVRSVHDDVLGDFDIPGMPVKFSEWREGTDLKAAALGEHNAEVLKEYLGLSDDEIKQLYTDNILIEEALFKA